MPASDPFEGSDSSADSPATSPSDSSLLKRIERGDGRAAEMIYNRYAERLRSLVRKNISLGLSSRLDGEDVLQSAFGSFFRRVETGSYFVPETEELWDLLMTITLNKIRAKGVYHRALKRDIRRTVNGSLISPDNLEPISDRETNTFFKLCIDEALDRLPSQHREAISLRMERYEVEEIAAKLGRPKRSVERLLQEARKRLGDLLGESSHDA